MNIVKINREIKRLRWSKAELARRMKIDRRNLHLILKRNQPTIRTVNRLAKALGLDPKDLLT